jgi:pyruvate formate lyase activating enzyme
MRCEPELMWYDVRCIAARECLDACPKEALQLSPQGMRIDRERCDACGKCVVACPSAALEVIGKEWTTDAVLAELLKDRVFYETSGGGVTFSGGEPALQDDFLWEILHMCRGARLHTALDTCAALPWERYARLLPLVDLVLLDLKIMDDARHRNATGASNRVILDNARKMAAQGKQLWVRTPVIPGYTQDKENIRLIGRFIRDDLPTVERWDLLAYTNLGKPKYHRLERPYALEETPLLTRGEMEQAWEAAVELVPAAQWSGATRL